MARKVYQAWPWMRSFITSAGPSGTPTQQSVDYMRNFTSAVPKGRLVMLDMRCECEPVYARTESIYGTSFVFEVMDDFGGTNGMFGDLYNVASRIGTASNDANATSLAGSGISMEGIDQNPVFYALVLDSLWTKTVGEDDGRGHKSIDNVTAFITDFGVRRCGKRLSKVERAWTLLANTTFRAGGGVGLGHAYCSNINPARGNWQKPSFWRGGYTAAAEVQAYADQLMEAWVLLTESAEQCNTASVRFDIADVGREWLQTVSCVNAYKSFAAAWQTHDPRKVAEAGATVHSALMEIDTLLASTPGLLFGEWLRDAEALGTTDVGRAQLVFNAKTQVTDWASYPPGEPWSHAQDPPGTFSGINNYALKQWGGLIKDYHAVRFQMFVSQAVADATANKSQVDVKAFEAAFRERQQLWVHAPWNKTTLPAEPVGDTVAVARKLQHAYGGVSRLVA